MPICLANEAINEALKDFFVFDIAPEVYSSLIVMGIIIILTIIVGIQSRFHNPLKKPRGLLFLAETGTQFFDNLVSDMMGPSFKGFGGYVMAIAVYLFIAFIFGLTGLPSPLTYLAVPLTLGLCTFVLIHATSVRFTKFRYFKRYIDPFPIFLPINLISMWSPLLSLTLRLFGNALAGWVLMSIVYSALEQLSTLIFAFLPTGINSIFIAPVITPILHAYFDLFSGFIQTTVFIFLTMIFIGQEEPEDIAQQYVEEGGK